MTRVNVGVRSPTGSGLRRPRNCDNLRNMASSTKTVVGPLLIFQALFACAEDRALSSSSGSTAPDSTAQAPNADPATNPETSGSCLAAPATAITGETPARTTTPSKPTSEATAAESNTPPSSQSDPAAGGARGSATEVNALPDAPAVGGTASAPSGTASTTPSSDGSSNANPANDAQVLEALNEYLAMPRDERGALEEQGFATQPLSRQGVQDARKALWSDHAAWITETRQAEYDDRVITRDELKLRFAFTIFGDAPEAGRSLYLSLHGGGNADPSVNDEQWQNQQQLYQPDEGVYLSPRAPTDTWNLWHEAHIDPMFERLIEDLIVLEGVNPNRVYVMGYSAGGDGVYQLGPRMADHWAAASAMAGHPNDAQPFSLRDIGFTIHVGGDDTAYDRNLKAQEWDDSLNLLEQADPGGYQHVVQVHAGKGHWMDLEDAVAVPWMAMFTRDPNPKKIVWYQDDVLHDRFYWLAVDLTQAQPATTLRASVDGQKISLDSDDVHQVRVRLSDELVDLDQPVVIEANGAEVWNEVVPRTIANLAKTLEERGDPASVWSGEVAAAL